MAREVRGCGKKEGHGWNACRNCNFRYGSDECKAYRKKYSFKISHRKYWEVKT